MNLSSDVFSELIGQFGSTFFGSLFEHCSSCPIWIQKDGMIRVTPPDGTKYYNFAWGDHLANRRKKIAALARARRRQCYIENRDRALAKSNFEARQQREI